MKKFFAMFLISTLLLSGCGNSSEIGNKNEILTEKKKESIEVQTQVITSEKRNSLLAISGTVIAAEEITISAEASGVVSQVEKDEGEIVKEGEKIMTLESNTNLLNASYSAAQAAYSNASAVLNLTKQSAKRSTQSAEINYEQARISYRKVKNSSKYQESTSESQTQSAEKSVEIAEKNFTITKKAYEQTLDNEKKLQENLLENTSNTLSKVLVDFRSAMSTSDDLIGASDLKRNENDDFEIYLIGTSQGVMLPTQDLWKNISPELDTVEEQFRLFEKQNYSDADEEKMLAILDDTVEASKSVRMVLRNIETMLRHSIPSKTFPQTQIDSQKSQIIAQQSSLEQNIASLASVRQSLSDFHIQSPQRILNAELNLSVSESQVQSSKQALTTSKSSEGLSTVTRDADLSAAKENLRSAESALQSAKTQADLSIQSAKSQYDSAYSSLEQARINLAKLVILSGVSGTVSQILRHDGDTVSPGTPLAVISDFSTLKLVSDISLQERLQISEGTKAEIYIEGIEKKFEGKVSLISPEADKITRRVKIEISLPNPDKIPANVFATATIKMKSSEDTIYIPENALQGEKKNQVFILSKNKQSTENTENNDTENFTVKLHTIIREENTTNDSFEYKVLEGLKKGDIIVSQSYKELEDGDIVTIKKNNSPENQNALDENKGENMNYSEHSKEVQ